MPGYLFDKCRLLTFDTFQNNIEINHNFKKYLKMSCGLGLEQYFSFKYCLKIAFVWEMSPK